MKSKGKKIVIFGIASLASLSLLFTACNNFFHDLMPPDDNRIVSFELPGQFEAAVIGDTVITVTVAKGADIRSLIPQISVSPKASLLPLAFDYVRAAFPEADIIRESMAIYTAPNLTEYVLDLIKRNPGFNVPALDMPMDFSGPVTFLVVSGLGTIRQYTVRVVEDAGNARLLGFGFSKYHNAELVRDAFAVVNEDAKTVTAYAVYPVEMTLSYRLIPAFEIMGDSLEIDGAVITSGIDEIAFAPSLGPQSKTISVIRNGAPVEYTLTVHFSEDPDTIRSITDFRFTQTDNPSIAAIAVAAIVNNDNLGTITVQVMYKGAKPAVLFPRFITPAKVDIAGVEQYSGVNSHDFSLPLEYHVVSRNGQYERTYTVRVVYIDIGGEPPRMVSFGFERAANISLTRDTAGQIVDGSGLILIEAHCDGAVPPEQLIPQFSATGTVTVLGSVQTSGMSGQRFTSQIKYTVTSIDDPLVRREYWVQVRFIMAGGEPPRMVSFGFNRSENSALLQNSEGQIVDSSALILIEAHYSGDFPAYLPPEQLVPQFSATGPVTVLGSVQTSGVSGQNFSRQVKYTVTSAYDPLTRQEYWVQVNFIQDTSSHAIIRSFGFHPNENSGLAGELNAVIDQEAGIINLYASIGSGVTARTMYPRFSAAGQVRVAGTPQTSGSSGILFDAPVVYTVVSANGAVQKDYRVTVREMKSRIYVDRNAAGLNDGVSWRDAFTSLAVACETAATYPEDMQKEIWIAEGTYWPSESGDRDAVFTLAPNTRYIGGFAGTETAIDQRNPSANMVAISGDVGKGWYPRQFSRQLFANTAALNGTVSFEDMIFIDAVEAVNVYANGIGVSNVTLENITGRGVYAKTAANGSIQIVNTAVRNNGGDALYLDGHDISINGVTLENIKGTGVYAKTAAAGSIRITGTDIHNTGKGGVDLSGGNAEIDDLVINNDGPTNNNYGLRYTGQGSVVIANADIQKVKSSGMGSGISLTTAGLVQITNAEIKNAVSSTGNPNGALYISGSPDVTLGDITIANVTGRGVHLAPSGAAYVTAERITIQNTTAGAWYQGGSNMEINDITVTNNGFISGNYGIQYTGAGSVVINNADINTVSYSSDKSGAGISVTTTGSVRIINSNIINIEADTTGLFDIAALYVANASGVTLDTLNISRVTGMGVYLTPSASSLIQAAGVTIQDTTSKAWSQWGGNMEINNITTSENGGQGLLYSGGGSAIIDNAYMQFDYGISVLTTGLVQITNTEIKDCYSTDGHLFISNSPDVTLADITIGNRYGSGGIGVRIQPTSTAYVKADRITIQNTGMSRAMAAWYQLGGNMEIRNITVSTDENYFNYINYGIRYTGTMGLAGTGSVLIDNANIQNVNYSDHGAGISINTTGSVQITNSGIQNVKTNNPASDTALYITNASGVTFNTLTIEDVKGTGIYLSLPASSLVQAAGINIQNTTQGAWYLGGGSVNINGLTIDNPTKHDGNYGFYYGGQGSVVINNANIQNVKSSNGAGIYMDTSGAAVALTIDNSTIQNAEASGSGGGIFIRDGSLQISGTTQIKNCKASYGGGVYFSPSNNSLFSFRKTGNCTIFGNDGGADSNTAPQGAAISGYISSQTVNKNTSYRPNQDIYIDAAVPPASWVY